MFNSLKEKLKNWVNKIKKPEETLEKIEKPVKKSKARKQSKTQKQKQKPEKQKLVEPITKFNPALEQLFEPDIEKTKELIQETEQKKSFWNRFKKDKKQEGIGESLNKETDKELTKKIYEYEIEKPEEEKPKPEPEKQGFFSKFKKKLDSEKFEELFSELELILLQNNVALEVTEKIKSSLRDQLVGKNLSDIDLESALKNSIEQILLNPLDIIKEIKKTLSVKTPYVIIFAGINGSGKTTTIAKLAHYLKKNKFTVCLAAADTFRAASIEQLQQHADKLNIPLIKKEYNSDPASVGFDAVSYAKKHHIDIVLIDTAGRLQNKDSLMREIEKIARVNKPDMKIFVGESITGNDATEQAKAFNDSIDLTGIILSKADVDEKGGTALSVSYVTKKPILFLGTGQSYDDFELFDKEKIIKKLGL